MTGQRFFAFIRAINTGGRRLTNADLIEPFTRLGFEDVEAYQAAGNITFHSSNLEEVAAQRIETALAETYGFDAPVFIRTQSELNTINAATPFSKEALAKTDGRIQVTFMRTAPEEATMAAVQGLVPKGERLVFSDREWFWLPTRGISDSELPVTKIEKLVGPMTIRTAGTISRMLNKFS